jgi:ABC-type transport system substrate-binding protein
VLTAGLLAAACAGGDEAADDVTASSAPVTTEAAGPTAPTTAPATTAAARPKRGGKLVVGVEADVANPWVPSKIQCDQSCQLRVRTFYEPLLAADTDGTMQPYLAERLEVNDDSTEFTMTLRQGVTFSDGTPFDAEAVAENARRYLSAGLTAAALGDVARNPDGSPKVEVIDAYTVRITTSRPWIDFPYYLASLQASPTWLRQTDTDPSKELQPVGTGPFVLSSWRPGQNLVVKRNPSYWRKDANGDPLPYLDEIEFRVIPDEQTRANALKAGDIDLMTTDSGENIAAFRENDGFQIVEQSDFGETFYILEHVGQQGSPLQDQRVRCGLLAATDARTLSETVGAGVTPVANGVFSPGQQGYLADNGNAGYDPDRAKQLIAAYTAERGKPTILFSTVTDSGALQTAQLLQAWWEEAGADVEIVQLEQAKLITNALLGDDAFMAFGWRNHGGFVLDQQYVWWHRSTAQPKGQLALNFGRLDDPVINDLLDRNRSEADPAKKREYGEAVNRRFAEQCWVIPTTWAVWGVVGEPDIRGIGETTFPDSTDRVRDGAGFAGQIWFHQIWRDQ